MSAVFKSDPLVAMREASGAQPHDRQLVGVSFPHPVEMFEQIANALLPVLDEVLKVYIWARLRHPANTRRMRAARDPVVAVEAVAPTASRRCLRRLSRGGMTKLS